MTIQILSSETEREAMKRVDGLPAIQIRTLGTLEVVRNGIVVAESEWRTRQAKQLLKILLTERPRPVATDRLIELLWAESKLGAAATTLRSAINALRNVLEPERRSRAPSRYIHTQAPGYAFRLHPDLWLDVEAFEDGLNQAERAGTAEEAHQLLSSALELYRDDYLIEDPYADWAKSERERLRERFVEGMLHLARLQADSGDYRRAIAACRSLLARDPVREGAYQSLIRFQAESGDSAGALLSYERCRQVLLEELGADPSPVTQELHGRILDGAIDVGQRPEITATATHPLREQREETTLEELPQQTLMPLRDEPGADPFVGRAHEKELLADALDDALAGKGSIALLSGEMGIGKSRLALETIQLSAAAGATVISGACQRLERNLSYAPLADAIGRYLQLLPESSLRRLSPALLRQLTQILPALYDRISGSEPGIEESQSPEKSRERLIDGVVTFLTSLADLRPLVLFLDDLHWADSDTLAVLSRLAKQLESRPIYLLLAYRQGEIAENEDLRDLLHALMRRHGVRSLTLERFSRTEVRQLLEHYVIHSDGTESLTSALLDATEGNPLFLSEALKALQERLQSHRSATDRVPAVTEINRLGQSARVQEIVRERIERLPQNALDVLQLAAVVGRDFSLELLDLAAQEDPAPGLEILLRRQFLREQLDDRLDFVHQVVRQVAYEGLNGLRRRRLHSHVGQALVRQRKGEENPEEVAFHFGEAGYGAREEYARFSVLAGEKALRAFSLRQALEAFDRGLGDLSTLLESGEEWIIRAFRGRGLAFEGLLDPDGVTDTYTRLRRWALETDRQELALVTHVRLTTLLGLVGQQAESNALMAGLLMDSETAPSSVMADLLRRRQAIFSPEEKPSTEWGRFLPPAPVSGNPVLEMEEALGPVQAALPLLIYGWLLQIQGMFDESTRCLEASVSLCEQTEQRSLSGLAYHQLAVTHYLQGNRARATQLNERSKQLNQQVHGSAAELASLWPRISSAYQAISEGELGDAQKRLIRVQHFLQNRDSFRTHRNSLIIGLGLIALGQGKLESAEKLLNEGTGDTQNRYPYTFHSGLLGLARIASARKETERCRRILQRALNYSGQRSLVREYLECIDTVLSLEPEGAPVRRLNAEAQEIVRGSGLLVQSSK